MPPNFRISGCNMSPEGSVSPDELISVVPTVENTGDENGDVNVRISADGVEVIATRGFVPADGEQHVGGVFLPENHGLAGTVEVTAEIVGEAADLGLRRI